MIIEEDFDPPRTAWRMEASLREFPPIRPISFFFDYPLHTLDTKGELSGYMADGSPLSNLALEFEAHDARDPPPAARRRFQGPRRRGSR